MHVVRWFSASNRYKSENFLRKTKLMPLSWWVILLWDANSIFHFQFLVFCTLVEVRCKKWKKSEFCHLLASNQPKNSSWTSNLRKTVGTFERICTHSPPCNGEEWFSWSYCTFKKATMFSFIVEWTFNPWKLQKAIKFSGKLHPFLNPNFLGSILFLIMFENALTVSLESLVFITFASTVQSNKSGRTSKNFTLFFSSCQFSSESKTQSPIFSFEPSNSLLSLESLHYQNHCVARSLERKNCLTYGDGRLLAFDKLRKNP